jgi:hypothetical protein
MGTPAHSIRDVAKQRWKPDDEVAGRMAAVRAKQDLIDRLTAEIKADLTALAIPTGGPAPVAALAELLGVERKTIYAYIGMPMASSKRKTGNES